MTRINSLADLRPGDIGFGPIGGAAGVLVGLGQLILGDDARYRHVWVVTDSSADVASGIGVKAVEAMPSGARYVDISDRWTDECAYIRLPDLANKLVISDLTYGDMVATEAKRLIGTPYSFLDYLALALRHHRLDRWGIGAWVRRRVTSSGRMICSQLVDQALTRAGVQVFDDGRLSQDVTPGALFYRLLQLGGSISIPGKPLV